MRILVMGLPGSGKTTLAKKLVELLNSIWYNADEVRKLYNDWDFSAEGRLRQARRMYELSTSSYGDVVCDFVAPTEEIRTIYNADLTIWMDTIEESRFEDTNSIFENPTKYDFRIQEKNSDKWAKIIFDYIERGDE
jgi:adenylylsulfate kinase